VPAGVKIQIAPSFVEVQGPKGKMSVNLPKGITLEQKGAELHAIRQDDEHAALHGLARALVANAVHGVTLGFKKDMDIVGVGYRAELKGNKEQVARLKDEMEKGPVTLLCGCADPRRCHRTLLQKHLLDSAE